MFTKPKLIVLLLILCLVFAVTAVGCSQKSDYKTRAKMSTSFSKKNDAEPTMERDTTNPTDNNKTAPLYGDPDSEVRAWHDPSKPPFSVSFLIEYFDDPSNAEEKKWLKKELWKWEWREGWESPPGFERNWKGAWYLVPSKLPPEPAHVPPPFYWPDFPKNVFSKEFKKAISEYPSSWSDVPPFGFSPGMMWYWKDNHWELGPEY